MYGDNESEQPIITKKTSTKNSQVQSNGYNFESRGDGNETEISMNHLKRLNHTQLTDIMSKQNHFI